MTDLGLSLKGVSADNLDRAIKSIIKDAEIDTPGLEAGASLLELQSKDSDKVGLTNNSNSNDEWRNT